MYSSNARFLVRHFAIPFAALAAALLLLERTPLDLWLADRWYAVEGGQWAWRDHWLTYDVIHHHGKQLVIGIGIVIMAVFAASFRSERLRFWRKPGAYLVTSLVLLPSLIAASKRFSAVPCPWDLHRYGGEAIYRHSLEYAMGTASTGHCFPAGHASGGFALLAAYFAALPFTRRPQWFLLPGLLIGWTFALGQEARGAHFISHDLWTLGICWFGALLLFIAFRPANWPVPAKEPCSA